MNIIIARKPATLNTIPGSKVEIILVERAKSTGYRFVCAKTNNQDAMDQGNQGEWRYGHYYRTLEEALEDFNIRR